MSLLRINIPGRPVEYVDLGYARGRVDRARSGSVGGPLTDARRPFQGERAWVSTPKPVKPYTPRPLAVQRCGKPTKGLDRQPSGVCFRRAGHGDGCRNEEAVLRDNARRRARSGRS